MTYKTRAPFVDIDGVLHPTNATDDLPYTVMPAAEAVARGLVRRLPVLEDFLAPHPDVLALAQTNWSLSFPEREIGDRCDSINEIVGHGQFDEYLILEEEHRNFRTGWWPLLACDPELRVSERGVLDQIEPWLTNSDQAEVIAKPLKASRRAIDH